MCDAEVCHGGKVLDCSPSTNTRKKKKNSIESCILFACRGKRREKKKKNSPASDDPICPHPVSPGCSSTLCFSALKMSFPDISSVYGIVVVWWRCPGVETSVEEVAGINSTRSQVLVLLFNVPPRNTYGYFKSNYARTKQLQGERSTKSWNERLDNNKDIWCPIVKKDLKAGGSRRRQPIF